MLEVVEVVFHVVEVVNNMGRVLAVAEGLGSLQDVVDAVRCMVTLELLVVLELLMLLVVVAVELVALELESLELELPPRLSDNLSDMGVSINRYPISLLYFDNHAGDEKFMLEQVPDLTGRVAVAMGCSEGLGYACKHTLLSKKGGHGWGYCGGMCQTAAVKVKCLQCGL